MFPGSMAVGSETRPRSHGQPIGDHDRPTLSHRGDRQLDGCMRVVGPISSLLSLVGPTRHWVSVAAGALTHSSVVSRVVLAQEVFTVVAAVGGAHDRVYVKRFGLVVV